MLSGGQGAAANTAALPARVRHEKQCLLRVRPAADLTAVRLDRSNPRTATRAVCTRGRLPRLNERAQMRNFRGRSGRVDAENLTRPVRAAGLVYGPRMRVKYASAGVAVCAALLFSAPTAFAQSAAQQGYSQPAGSVEQQLGSAQHHPVSKSVVTGGGGLPFTGLDLGLVAGAGGALLAMGFAMRRLSRSEPA